MSQPTNKRGDSRTGAPDRSSGQAMVEFALTIIPFLMLVFAVIEGGRMVATYFALENAAREGSRAGRYLASSSSTTGILNGVNTTANVFAGSYSSVTVDTNKSSCGTEAVCVCHYTSATAATNAACSSMSALRSGSVVDVTVKHTFSLLPLMNSNAYYCLLCMATIQMMGYHRAIME